MSLDCCPVMKLVSSSITSSVFQIMILNSYLHEKHKQVFISITKPSQGVAWWCHGSLTYPLGLRGDMSTGGPRLGISIGKMSTHICSWPWGTLTKLHQSLYHTNVCNYSNWTRLDLPGPVLVCSWGTGCEFQCALGQVYSPHPASLTTCVALLKPGAHMTPPSDLWCHSTSLGYY